MDSRCFLALSLCFFCLFPHVSHSRVRIPNLIDHKQTYLSTSPCHLIYLSVFVFCHGVIWLDIVCISSVGSVLRLKRGPSSATFDPTRVTQLSWSPRFSFSICISISFCSISLCRVWVISSVCSDLQGFPLQGFSFWGGMWSSNHSGNSSNFCALNPSIYFSPGIRCL